MGTLHVLIADGSDDFGFALAEELNGRYNVRICADGTEALELIQAFLPDIIVLDLMLPGLDGISLLQQVAQADMHPAVLATTRFISNYVLEMVEKLGVGYLMLKPCDIKATVSRIGDLTQRIKMPRLSAPDTRVVISNLLRLLGVPTKLRGYNCLREAILIMSRDSSQSITKELYPAVAAVCGGTAAQVERAVRGAIQAAWQNRDEEVWRHYLQTGVDGQISRPTNASFISGLADQLMLEKEEEYASFAG